MKKRIQGMLRVASFAGVVVTAVSWVGVRQARSELREQTAVLEASLLRSFRCVVAGQDADYERADNARHDADLRSIGRRAYRKV